MDASTAVLRTGSRGGEMVLQRTGVPSERREPQVFGRRGRQAELEAITTALKADADARRDLADALARIDARLERGLDDQAQTQTATGVTVQHLRSTVVDTRNDLAHAVDHLARVCALLSDRIDAERIERQAIIETMSKLALSSAAEPPRSAERVIGGSFPAVPAETIDVTAEAEHRQSRWA